MFDSRSQDNLIAKDLVKNIGLEVNDHPSPYPFSWVKKDVDIKVKNKCKINFFVSVNFI
jgi:hypothetical protein